LIRGTKSSDSIWKSSRAFSFFTFPRDSLDKVGMNIFLSNVHLSIWTELKFIQKVLEYTSLLNCLCWIGNKTVKIP
jgi:hypothetical protein